jgi:hypothetical protein
MPIAWTASVLRRFAGLARHDFGEQRHDDQDQSAGRRHDADQRMKQVADGEIERHPGQVEQRRRSHSRQERAHLVEIAQRLQTLRRRALERQFHQHVMNALAQGTIQRAADPHQQAAADDV